MTTKFNIGDTVIGPCGKFKIDSIRITDKGVIYSGDNCTYSGGLSEDELTKAPITREEALAAALKDVGERVSKRIDVELSEITGCFEVRSSVHYGAYIPMSKEEYYYEE